MVIRWRSVGVGPSVRPQTLVYGDVASLPAGRCMSGTYGWGMIIAFMQKLICAPLFAAWIVAAAEDDISVIRPAAIRDALINPGMGWVHFHYSNRLWAYGGQQPAGDTLDWFPGCSTIYFRIPWCYLEPEEGKFRWDLIDSHAQPWVERGKKIALRIIASEDRFEYATPEWVKNAGAKGIYYHSGQKYSPEARLWDPIFDDPIFLKKLGNFLAAMARRYNGNPDVAFIDIGSFGLWGEGHTGYSSKLNQEQTDKAVKLHIDLHKKYFPDTLLAISDDVAGASRPGANFPITDYAFSQGVTLRDDSILVGKAPRQWYHAEMAQKFWPTLPVILEHGHYDWLVLGKSWDQELLVRSVEEYRASYMSIHGWPEAYLKENRAAIDRINQRLGYRLELREVRMPKAVRVDEVFSIETAWANVGVAPCYGGGNIAFTLKDSAGKITWVVCDPTFDVRALPTAAPGEAQEIRHRSPCQLGIATPIPTINEGVILRMKERGTYPPFGENVPTLKKGPYDVFVSIGRPDGTPVIALPLGENDGKRRYRVGAISVE